MKARWTRLDDDWGWMNMCWFQMFTPDLWDAALDLNADGGGQGGE